jgi:DNA-binding YbaB/EbfC family protein
MFDMMKLMGKMQEVQARMKEAQEKLGQVTAEGEAGAGMVKAVANGKRQLVSLHIDKEMLKPEDMDMLTDLIVAACNNALKEVDEKAKEEMRKSTEGLMPNIPGLDLGGMF